jgi:hypothetical protein
MRPQTGMGPSMQAIASCAFCDRAPAGSAARNAALINAALANATRMRAGNAGYRR